jgi:hypothetical protein
MIVSISVELSPLTRKFQSFCLADLNSQARCTNFVNVHYIPWTELWILSKGKLDPLAGCWNFPLMNGILWQEVENFSLADGNECSALSIILSTTVELCLPTGKFKNSATEIAILWLEVESFSKRMAFSNWKLRMAVTQIVLNLTAGRWLYLPALNHSFK